MTLDLRHNRISHLRSSTFVGLVKIRGILLFDNSISQVEAGTFYSTPNLVNLHLDKNKIVFLSWDIFVLKTKVIRKPKVKCIYLHDNNISCGKENCWMQEFIKKRLLFVDVKEGCWDGCPHSSTYTNNILSAAHCEVLLLGV